MNLNELRDKIHVNALQKGFNDDWQTAFKKTSSMEVQKTLTHAFFSQRIALIHSELSEALEADRVNWYTDYNSFNELSNGSTPCVLIKGKETENFIYLFERFVKNSVEDELADVIIRVLDLCGSLNIDIEKHIEINMKYNELRKYKHGKEY